MIFESSLHWKVVVLSPKFPDERLKAPSSAPLISRYILRLGQRRRCCSCAACPNLRQSICRGICNVIYLFHTLLGRCFKFGIVENTLYFTVHAWNSLGNFPEYVSFMMYPCTTQSEVVGWKNKPCVHKGQCFKKKF